MQFNNYVAIVNGIYFILNNMSKIRANINSLSRSRSNKVIFQYEIFPSSDKMQIKMCKTFVESNCTFLKYHFTKFNAFSILQNWLKEMITDSLPECFVEKQNRWGIYRAVVLSKIFWFVTVFRSSKPFLGDTNYMLTQTSLSFLIWFFSVH